jgi:glycosyltransferase involved in cell wall biosynthesis
VNSQQPLQGLPAQTSSQPSKDGFADVAAALRAEPQDEASAAGPEALLAGETILCFAADAWAGVWRNRHQIMTRLARRNTVLYVEPRLYLGETRRRLRDGRLRPADLCRPLAEHYRDGLWIYHDPYYAPYSGRLSGGRITAAIRRRALRRTLGRMGGSPPILWLLRPYHMDQIGQYGEKLVVYHVTDEYSAYPQEKNPAEFRRAEIALLRRADLVIVTSPGLLADKTPANPRTYLVPNAVDYAGFQAALASGRQLAFLRDGQGQLLTHPRIGYVGALNEKLDVALLAAIARARPDWQFLVVGFWTFYDQPQKLDLVHGLPNVFLPGPVPVEDVPLAIAACDVCILPYERNAWTENIDSLKLYEYLACGRPIVSTNIPAARNVGDVVRIANEPAAFVAAIAAALAEDSPELAARRRVFAAANTWEMRVTQISELLSAALKQKIGP